MKVLLADDQHSIHVYLKGMINWEELGIHEMLHAYDGEDTFETIIKHKPDITILDIEMPKLSGIDVLKKIKDIYFPKTIILSAFDKFQYARDAVELGAHNYILKPIDPVKMTKELKLLMQEITTKTKQQIEEKISHLIHYGSKEVLDDIHHHFTTLTIQYFRAVYVKLLNDVNEELIQSLTNSLRNDHFVVPLGPLELMIIPFDSKPITDESLAVTCQPFKSAPNITMIGGASPVESDVQHLPSMIEKTLEIANMGFYQENTIHIYSKKQFSELDITTVNSIVQEFTENLEVGYISDHVIESISNVFSYAETENVHPSHLYQYCYKLLNAIDQFAPSILDDYPFSLSIEHLQNEYQTLEEMHQLLLKIMEDIDIFLSSQLSDRTELFERIKRYIDNNYSADLTLKHVAQIFHVDKYSLSKSFKKYFDINYGSYVMKVRMEKAMELLTSSDLKVHQVAEKVGYSDESTFSHAFKKMYGTSPIGYKKSNE